MSHQHHSARLLHSMASALQSIVASMGTHPPEWLRGEIDNAAALVAEFESQQPPAPPGEDLSAGPLRVAASTHGATGDMIWSGVHAIAGMTSFARPDDARRLVACSNACAGVPTAKLEVGAPLIAALFTAQPTATAPTTLERPVCARCGSDDVRADAFAIWNHAAQDWEVASIMDDGHSCEACGGECDLEFVPAAPSA